MERSELFWNRAVMVCVVVGFVLLVSGFLVLKLPQPRDDFQSSNCTPLCPSSDNCTASENGVMTCNTTDGSDRVLSSSVSSTLHSRRVRTAVVILNVGAFMWLCVVVGTLLVECFDYQSRRMVMKGEENDPLLHDIIIERMEFSSNLIGGEHSCATDQLKAAALDDEMCKTESHSEFVPGQDSHSSRPGGAAWQPLTEPPKTFRTNPQVPPSPLSDTAFDDTAKHTTVASSLAIVPDDEAALSRRHGPTDSSHHIATHNTAKPPVVAPRPFPGRSERSILFRPEIIVVPDEIMTSSNASKLFRRCARLHDHLESLMELDIISPQLCCQVTAECQSHGNMSGLALLYRQVKQAGNEVRFLAELRAHREEMAICTSSIGSDEAGGAASRISETSSSSSSATSLDSASATSLLSGHETLMWVQALDNLEDLIYEGILTVYQFAYIVDLASHDWRISALMQVVKGCRKLTRLQCFLATPPTTPPPMRGSLHGAATTAGAGRNPQQ